MDTLRSDSTTHTRHDMLNGLTLLLSAARIHKTSLNRRHLLGDPEAADELMAVTQAIDSMQTLRRKLKDRQETARAPRQSS